MSGEARTETIRLSLSPTEKAELRGAADKAGLPLASWARAVLLAAARKDGA